MDHSRFTAYIERYGDLVTRLLLLRCRQVEDAQDCFQAVFLKLYTHGGDDWEPERVKAWLIRTAIHEAASLNRQVWQGGGWCCWGTPPTLKGLPRRAAPGRELLDTLRTLPEHQREVLYLHYYEGYSVQELSEILNVRPGTVKSRLSRARDALKTKLEEEGLIHEMGCI